MGLGRKLAAALAGAVVLWLAPNAVAADQLLETINVDTSKMTVTTGTTQLQKGTKYELQVSGTFTINNNNTSTPAPQIYDEDALYCYGDSGFDSPQCTTSGSPGPQRFGPASLTDFAIGSGNSSLNTIDAYQEPAGGGTPLGYSISHTYVVDFYPPVTGPLTAGGHFVLYGCGGCLTTVAGTITIQIYGPGGGGGGGGGGGAPNGWTIGGGAELYPPSALCRVQRGFPEAPDAQTAALGGGTQTIDHCVDPRLLNSSQKEELRLDAKAALILVGAFCGAAASTKDIQVYAVAKSYCQVAVGVFLEIATKLVHDPPDPHFTVPPGFAPPLPLGRAAASPCPPNLSRAQCAALRTALSQYQSALGALDSVAGDLAIGANRTASAVAAHALVPAFFQEAFAKVNEGALAGEAAALGSYGKTLATILRADHLDITVSPSQAKAWLSKHPPSGVSKKQLTLVTAQLSSHSGRKLSALMSPSIATTTSTASYKSTSLIDLASIVNGLVVSHRISTATGKRLATDLTSALNVCQRTAALNQFIADAVAQASSFAQFLKFAAQPLLAAGTPSSCGTTPPPTFTGSWNTTWFGAVHLTQTGNQVTGTYSLCNGTATITGTVTGSTLNGTWSEPCDNGQGQINAVLSSDGNSFSGFWGEGTNTPTVGWTGTRTS